MLLYRLTPRAATVVRFAGLILISWSVITATPHPATSGRGLVVGILLALSILSWLVWTVRPMAGNGVGAELYLLSGAGGALVGASPNSAASAFVFVAVVAAGVRVELIRAVPVAVVGVLLLSVSHLLYDESGLGLLAYGLGIAAALLAASNARQTVVRAEQAELLLAQSQRSHEEQVRAARLEESTRIAREIHDVLAHTLAGLSIQLEATGSLIEQGADRDIVLQRVRHANEIAREGLRETRRAVGALRGELRSTDAGIAELVADFRATADAPVQYTIDGDTGRLIGATGEAVLRIAQESLTNIRKHAPGANVSISVHAGVRADEPIVLLVEDHTPAGRTARATSSLASSGGGFGLVGMRERAEQLGGTLNAGSADRGWRVELRLPAPNSTAPVLEETG